MVRGGFPKSTYGANKVKSELVLVVFVVGSGVGGSSTGTLAIRAIRAGQITASSERGLKLESFHFFTFCDAFFFFSNCTFLSRVNDSLLSQVPKTKCLVVKSQTWSLHWMQSCAVVVILNKHGKCFTNLICLAKFPLISCAYFCVL